MPRRFDEAPGPIPVALPTLPTRSESIIHRQDRPRPRERSPGSNPKALEGI